MKDYQYNYDVFPIVFPVGKPTDITVKPRGKHAAIFPEECTVRIYSMTGPFPGDQTEINVKRSDDGCLRFTFTAKVESEHYIRIFYDPSNDRNRIQVPVYALDPDLAERLPFRGDLHLHTFRSDGRQDPGTVCANYRKFGYDFAAITDHGRYYPSLEAMKAYENVRIPLNILPGEEVQLPYTPVHIINAGGLYSVNGLLECCANYKDTNGADEQRRLNEDAPLPPIVPMEQYDKEIEEIEKTLTDCPEDVDRRSAAVCFWAFDRIREGGGLAVFAHPFWISNLFQLPEKFTLYMMKKKRFDAFEVLGGELYYEQNGLQTALYYDEYKEGRIHAIVGSTDSHNSTDKNNAGRICTSIIFAKENERAQLVEAVKDLYSVAVDTISKEYRLVGSYRLQKYGAFLMENWYPIHDRLCAWDGELMRMYYNGECEGEELTAASDKSGKMFAKYFAR